MSLSAVSNTTSADDRQYIAGLESETRRLHAEARHIEAEAARLGAQVRLAEWKRMRRRDEFHASHPWVRLAIMITAVLSGALVGVAVALIFGR